MSDGRIREWIRPSATSIPGNQVLTEIVHLGILVICDSYVIVPTSEGGIAWCPAEQVPPL